MITATPRFPHKPHWILSVGDLPTQVKPARYQVAINDDETKEITLSKRKRQVVDALMSGNLFCASTVRIGDTVFRLKEDYGKFIDTDVAPNGRKFYTLSAKVSFLGEVAA